MSRYHGPKEALDAARDPATGPQELRELARSVYGFVQLAVARHPAAEAAVLASLVPSPIRTHHEQALAAAVAAHPAAPAAALAQIAAQLPAVLHGGRNTYWARQAGLAVCRHQATPPHALQALLTDQHVATDFRRRVAAEATRPEVLAILLNDPSAAVRARAARRSTESGQSEGQPPRAEE